MKLYEIDSAIADVITRGYCLDEETGEIFFDASDLEQLEADRVSKLEGCAVVIKQLEADAAAFLVEEQKLSLRRQRMERKCQRLKDYVANSMVAAGEERIETPKVALSFRKSTAVDVLDVEQVPSKYLIETTTYKPDKAGIKVALQRGELVDGVQLITNKNLQVK